MKKYLIFMLSGLFIFSIAVKAQESVKKSSLGVEKRVEKMATELGLTDIEKGALKNLLVKQENEEKKLKTELTSESGDFKLKMKELRDTHVAELKKLIGEERYNQFKENRAKEKMKAAEAQM